MKFRVHPQDLNISCLATDSEFDLFISPKWGSDIERSREALQKFIDEARPLFYSVSHAPGLGGVLFAASTCGLDVELTDRVTEKIVKRISSPSEWDSFLKTNLPLSYLWSAKESAWKSLRGRSQPPTISDLELSWESSRTAPEKSSHESVPFSIRTVRGAPLSYDVQGSAFQQGAYTLSWSKEKA